MIIRDLGGIIVGLGLIVHQVLTVKPGELNEMVLLILALVAGMPGAAQVVSLIRSGSLTELPSSSLPQSPSPSDSPPSSHPV